MEGVVIGVSSGIVQSAVYWISRRLAHYFERREQIAFLRSFVAGQRDTILGAKGFRPFLGRPLERRAYQAELFRSARRRLGSILDERATRMTFDESNAIHEPIEELYELVELAGRAGEFLGENEYKLVFDQLEKLEWLKLRKKS